MTKTKSRGKRSKTRKKRVSQRNADEIVAKLIPDEVESIKDLPKPAKVAIVHGMKDLEYSYRQIQRVLGIDKDTAHLYVNTEIDDRHIRFRDAVKEYFFERNATLKSLAQDAIQVKLKDSEGEKLKDVVQAYKVISEVDGVQRSSAANTGNVMTINVHPAVTRGDSGNNEPIIIENNST